MADRIVVMNHGVIEQVGNAGRNLSQPRDAFVADFVGPMTFLDAVVSARTGCASAQSTSPARPSGFSRSAGAPRMRPEEVRVRELDASTPNRLHEGRALDFLGSFCRARLEPDAAPGIARRGLLDQRDARSLRLGGQTLTVALPPSAAPLSEDAERRDDPARRRRRAAGSREIGSRASASSAGRVAVSHGRAAAVGAVVEELPERQWRVHRPCQLHPLFLDADPVRLDLQQRLGRAGHHDHRDPARLRLRLCADAQPMRVKGLFHAVALLPIFAPSLLSAISLIYLFGNQGLLKGLLFGGSIYGAARHRHRTGLLLLPACADDRRHRAGARRRAALRGGRCARHKEVADLLTVTLPGREVRPHQRCFVVFTLVITDFGVAKVIGGQFNVLATDVYKQVVGQQNFEMGAVVGMILLMPAVLAFVVDRIVQRRQVAPSVGTRRAARAKDNRRARYCAVRLLRGRRRILGVLGAPCGPRSSPTGPTT